MCFYLNLYHFSAWFDRWPVICEYHSRCLTTPITVRRFHAPCSVKVTCMSVKRFKFYISEKSIVWKITVEYKFILWRKMRFWRSPQWNSYFFLFTFCKKKGIYFFFGCLIFAIVWIMQKNFPFSPIQNVKFSCVYFRKQLPPYRLLELFCILLWSRNWSQWNHVLWCDKSNCKVQ